MSLWIRRRDDVVISATLIPGMNAWGKVQARNVQTGRRFWISAAGLQSSYRPLEDEDDAA